MFKKMLLVATLALMGANLSADEPQDMGPSDVHGMCWTGDQIAGPIWDNNHAQQVCPGVCSNVGGSWTGNWVTVIWGRQSVCSCRVC